MTTAAAPMEKHAHLLMSTWSCGQRSLTRIDELSTLCDLMAERSGEPSAAKLAGEAKHFLQTARQAADRKRPPWGRFGAFIDTIETNIHAAICLMLSYMPLKYLWGWLPELSAIIREHLPLRDPRRAAVEALLQPAHPGRASGRAEEAAHAAATAEPEPPVLDESKRETIVTAIRAALGAQEREYVRVRSFRNIVYGVTVCLTVLAVSLAIIMAVNPMLAPICFHPEAQIVCPTASGAVAAQAASDSLLKSLASRADYFVIELVGLIAAAVAAAASLRQLRGTAVPYSVPLALALLKLPTGALTAILGLLLMRGEFIPGLSALDTSAQIISWAIVFGYAQQLFTRMVDERGQAILNSVGGAEHGTLMDQRMSPSPGASP